MTEQHMLSCVSFLLGKTHGGIVNILISGQKNSEKIDDLQYLADELRKEIEQLYYPTNSHSQDTLS